MQALAFWRTVTADHAGFLDRFLAVLNESGAAYCIVGGQAVNAYVEPVVSLDLDVVVAAEGLPAAHAALARDFRVERFPHSLNVSEPGSDLRVQLRTDPRYAEFVGRAEPRDVLGLTFPVAQLEDVLQGKGWAASDASRRPSKRQKDLADISRLLELRPELRSRVPGELLARII
jgi:hypothetical protein